MDSQAGARPGAGIAPVEQIRLPARLICDRRDYGGNVVALGENFASLLAHFRFAAGEAVELECLLPPWDILRTAGRIAACEAHESDDPPVFKLKVDFGPLDDPARTVLREYLGSRATRRREPRPKVSIPARLLAPERINGLAVLNVSTRGLFIASDAPFAIDTPIRVSVGLPSFEVSLNGRVAHAVDRATARRMRRPSGFGVELTELPPAERQAWDRLRDRAGATAIK